MKKDVETLNLVMPQWQGGNNPAYYFGCKMLAWLAPQEDFVEVGVASPTSEPLPLEDGIVGRTQLLEQLRSAQQIIESSSPRRITVLGGDCLVDLAPFAYLSKLYQEKFGILWIDAHPDIMTSEHFSHAHAMVLGNLMGMGDRDFVAAVEYPVPAANVMYAGLGPIVGVEAAFIAKHSIVYATADETASGSQAVLDWIAKQGITKLAVHLDLDVMDASKFHSLLFANPNVDPSVFDGITQGTMAMPDVIRLLNDVRPVVEIVGIGVTEHLPWDAIAMKDMLSKLPLIGAKPQ